VGLGWSTVGLSKWVIVSGSLSVGRQSILVSVNLSQWVLASGS